MIRGIAGLLWLILSISAGPVAADEQTSTARVETFHAALLEVMRIREHEQRETVLEPKVVDTFDTRRIAAISLGRTWRTLSEAQQQEFIELLTELIVATYADRFDSYKGQRFVTDAVAPVKSGFVVQTRLLRETGEPVTLDYFLRDDQIFNVVADGVSDLSLRRADYNSIVKQEGYAQLLNHMRDKISLARPGQ